MRYTILFCLCFMAYGLLAQNTPSDRSFAAGIAAYNGGQYEKAVKHFLTARLVNGWVENEKKKAEGDSWTAKCYNAIRAEAALQMAVQLDRPHAYDYVIKSFPNTPQAQAATNKLQLPPLKPIYTETVNGVTFTMVEIPGGAFTMGDFFEEGREDETQHPVTLSGYHLGATEVTQVLWLAVMGSNPSHFSGCAQCPVEQVSWADAVAFIGKLNKLATSGHTYRLPTEAEWEYAAREGGKQVRFGNGSNEANPAQMNFDGSKYGKQPYSIVGVYRRETTPVKTFSPNALGLYDMAGNVYEWCADWYGAYGGAVTNPQGPNTGSVRVIRGGSWSYDPHYCRVTDRNGSTPGDRTYFIGFRLASQ